MRDVIENTIKAFEAYKCYLRESEETGIIKFEEDIPTHLLLKLNFNYQDEEVRYPDIKLTDPRYGYFGFESIITGYFSFQLKYDDFIHNKDANCIDINKVIKWLDGRVLFLEDLMFFDEDSADDYYRELCEITESKWKVIKANSHVYQKNLRTHKLQRINKNQMK
jgi:hypothetical protein